MSTHEILRKYVPEKSIDYIADFLKKNNVQLKITKSRSRKLGDYSPPLGRLKHHRITINYDLNKYQFLLTFLHEEAHYHIWRKYKNRVAPHGREWQELYRKKAMQFLTEDYFPKEVLPQLFAFFNQETLEASSSSISRIFKKHTRGEDFLTLEDIPYRSSFQIADGKKFIKERKLRTYYLCTEIDSGRKYRVHKNAEVQLLSEPSDSGQKQEISGISHKNPSFKGEIGGKYLLQELPEGVIFEAYNGDRFRKGRLLRTYYECFLLPGEEVYRVHRLAEVRLIGF